MRFVKSLVFVSLLMSSPGAMGVAAAGEGAPLRLEFRQSGFLGPGHAFFYDASARPTPFLVERDLAPGGGGIVAERRYTVAPESWARLRRELEAMRVWTWRSDCSNPQVRDGTQWRLEIVYPDRSLGIFGSNAFPKAGGGCERNLARSRELRRLEAVLRRAADD